MVAGVRIEEITGDAGSPTITTKSTNEGVDSSRYYTSDASGAALTTNPIPIPNDTGGGVSGSYWKTHRLYVYDAPSVRIENVRFYVGWTSHPSSQWALGYGGDHIIGVSSSTITDCRLYSQGFFGNSYDQATGTEGTCGDFISGAGSVNHTYYAACTNGHTESLWAFSSQTGALMVQSGQAIGAGTGPLYYIVTQVLVASGATQGEKDDVTATWVYDEV
jgi:hypothetical protein